MISILHLSDLHIAQSGHWHNLHSCILEEARSVRSKPRGEKLLVLTGDFRNFWDSDYSKAEEFLTKLFTAMDIDPATGVFVVPGNHDVGNEALMNQCFPGDEDWDMHKDASVSWLKNHNSSERGYKRYLQWRMESYRPFCQFLKKLGIPDADGAAAPHVRQWPASGKPKLNLFHLNTTLVADGEQKDNQRVDLLGATDDQLWKGVDPSLPALALGHNSFFDLDKSHRTALEAVFSRHNVCAYLCGDTHKEELDRDRQLIRLSSGYSDGATIPNIVGVKGAADDSDNYSDFGLYWHEWDEEAGVVHLRLLSWKPKVEQAAFLPGREDNYDMPRLNGAKAAASAEQNAKKPAPVVKQSEDGFNAQGNNQNSTSTVEPDVEDHTEEYRNRWTEKLFLNRKYYDFDTVAEVSLRDVYTDCRYSIWNPRTNKEDNPNKKDNPNKEDKFKAAKALRKSLSGNGGHLVLGAPGIGKSTLISWYLNPIDEASSRQVLVYPLSKFTLNMTDSHPDRTLLTQMGYNKPDELKGCILFLDGLDECGLVPDERARLLKSLQDNWGHRFSWVVTCRQHYIPDNDLRNLTQIQRITLLPMESEDIGEFLEKYEKAAKASVSESKRAALTSKKFSGKHGSVFGVPLILYMTAAMAEIQVTMDSTLVSVYDQLFKKLFERAYDMQSHHLPTEKQRRAIQTMDRHIALWMLFNEPEKAVIPREKYDSIYDSIYSSIKKTTDRQVEKLHLHKFHSYMHHTEGESERCYIHRTMYEYFVADGFVAEALAAKSAEELSGVIAWYWHKTEMSPTIQDYIRDKLKQPENKALCSLSDWEEAGKLLMTKGVKGCPQPSTDAVPGCPFPAFPETLAKDRVQENTAFYSLCRLLNGVRVAAGEERRIYESAASETLDALTSAILNCGADRFEVRCPNFWLQGADLRSAHLEDAILVGADLTNAHLTRADLSGAGLTNANLTRADLTNADLTRADLTRADLMGANLTLAHLAGADLRRADLEDAILVGANLTDARLTGAHLTRAHLKDAYLVGADLTNAHLTRADLSGAGLTNANLTRADLTNADLTRADLTNAHLTCAHLEGVHLVGAYLTHALLTDEQVMEIGETALASCTFSQIYVRQRGIVKIYLRNDFFNEFFPKAAPNPPSNSK